MNYPPGTVSTLASVTGERGPLADATFTVQGPMHSQLVCKLAVQLTGLEQMQVYVSLKCALCNMALRVLTDQMQNSH